ncbi:MAG: hypothetical protein NTV33_00560 [Coprothermobacterota bacterium]|nr:hypothetical protein [Coprothermobacterota bacterium]
MAPQCGISSDVTEANRSVEQPACGWRSRGNLPHFDTEHPAGGYSAQNKHPAGGYSAQNTLPGAIQLRTPCRGLSSRTA